MANWNDNPAPRPGIGVPPGQTGRAAGTTTLDAGLRAHMLAIYNYMASGVLLTGIVAMLFANTPSLMSMLYTVGQTARGPALEPTILGWIVMLAPVGIVLAMSFGGVQRFSATVLQGLFWLYAALFGASISYILLLYTGASVAATFFATAGAFAGLSLFGYTTKRSLSGMGSFLIMGVVGLIIASLVNVLFLQSSAFDMAISVIGVLIFAGLTAYHTQRLKDDYAYVRGTEWEAKQVVLGALTLYMAFVNMFLFLLRLMGNRN